MATVVSLTDAVEQFHGATLQARQPTFRELVSRIRDCIQDGCVAEAALALRRTIVPSLDYTSFQSLYRLYKSIVAITGPAATRVAVLGGATNTKLAMAVELALFSMNGRIDAFETDYGAYRQDILDPDSDLYAQRPNTVFLATTWRDLVHRPKLVDSSGDVQKLVESEVAHWANLWRTANQRLGCQIIQNNFDRPAWRQLSNHDSRHAGGFHRFINLVNQILADSAPHFVLIHDLDDLSASAGRTVWGDERFFHHAKMPCPPPHLVDYGFSVASLLAAQMGLTKKCLVLDLDNTLWGGVIGDDGLGGIRLGQGDGEGEAFLAFQRYAKALKDRGVLLAVCSKNTDHVAREVFEKHPEMVLRLEDISCFMANWNDKASNLREIARTLNIGLDSLVFADDNPVERALVRQLAPEVAVPELPLDPADYIRAVERHRYFQITSLGSEDLLRVEYYRANKQREEILGASENVEDFLASLAMVARIAPVDDISLERTAQLINKSNQFNLTTRRRTAAEVMALASHPDWFTCTVSLRDRFGDNGLISVLFAKREDEILSIDTWLMSCRVLKRGVETFLHNYLCRWALNHGIHRIRGEYIPTAKNSLVKNHYAALGFAQATSGRSGADSDSAEVDRTVWEFPISADWTPQAVQIEMEDGFAVEEPAVVIPFPKPAIAADTDAPHRRKSA
jgi:FkbH-like protein